MQVTELIPLSEIEVNRQDVLAIQRNELVPIFNNAALLHHYAEQLVQAHVSDREVEFRLCEMLIQRLVHLK